MIPAVRAARITPIDAMRDDARRPAAAARWRAAIAVGLGAMTAWLLGWAAFGTFRPFERGFQDAGLGALGLFGAVIALGHLVVGPLAAGVSRRSSACSGRRATGSVQRRPSSPAQRGNAAALMAGIALVTLDAVVSSSARASVVGSWNANLRADVIVEPIGDRDIGTELADELRAREEVADVVSPNGWRSASATTRTR